jgi:hypothetical protein
VLSVSPLTLPSVSPLTLPSVSPLTLPSVSPLTPLPAGLADHLTQPNSCYSFVATEQLR